MPRNKSITSIDNRIKKVQEDLFKTKARLDKLTAELRGLEREKKFRQADAILQALSKSGKSLDDVLTFFGALTSFLASRVGNRWKFTSA